MLLRPKNSRFLPRPNLPIATISLGSERAAGQCPYNPPHESSMHHHLSIFAWIKDLELEG